MILNVQKRIAAGLLKCSPKKVIFDTLRLADIKEAITKQDLRALIKEGAIKRAASQEQSRVRARKRDVQRAKGRQRGVGTRKGHPNARVPSKRRWMGIIRSQRLLLQEIRPKLAQKDYRELYMKAKGGFFRSKRHLELYINERGILSK